MCFLRRAIAAIIKRKGSETIDDDRDRLRRGLAIFYDNPIEQDLRRNRVQERLLAASARGGHGF